MIEKWRRRRAETVWPGDGTMSAADDSALSTSSPARSTARPKDLDDFRVLSLNLNKEELRQRVLQGSSSLASSDQIRRQAIRNWYIVYGDDLGLSLNSGAGDSS